MAGKPSPTQPPARARLRLESLEERWLPALAVFSVNLYRDAGGAPGELIADDTVQVGETFFVELLAQDLRSEPTGPSSAATRRSGLPAGARPNANRPGGARAHGS